MLFPSNLYTNHKGQRGSKLSPRLWSRALDVGVTPDGSGPGFMFYDDFLNFGAIAAATNASGGYAGYIDTGNTIKALATASGGVVQFLTDGTDNDECWLTTGGNSGVLGAISDTAGSDKLTIFEARVRFGQIGNTYNAFVGCSEEGLAAADTVTDAGAMADKDFIGFAVLEADGDALKFVYRKAGGAMQTVFTYGTALAASTWYNLGFVYDPVAPASQKIKVFINNEEQNTYVTAANIAAATFPDGEELALLAGIKNGGAAASSLDVDLWAFYQAG